MPSTVADETGSGKRKDPHSEKCKASNQVNHLYELDLRTEGTGIEEFQAAFKKKTIEKTISHPTLTSLEIWRQVKAEMVTEPSLGVMVPESKTVSNMRVVIYFSLCYIYNTNVTTDPKSSEQD